MLIRAYIEIPDATVKRWDDTFDAPHSASEESELLKDVATEMGVALIRNDWRLENYEAAK